MANHDTATARLDIQIAAPPLGIDVRPIDVREPIEIENGIATLANMPNGGIIITGSALPEVHRDLIIKLAAQHQLPAVYRFYATEGGLVSYGPAFNVSMRKFLKKVGITSQREIEKAVRAALANGKLEGHEALPAKVILHSRRSRACGRDRRRDRKLE